MNALKGAKAAAPNAPSSSGSSSAAPPPVGGSRENRGPSAAAGPDAPMAVVGKGKRKLEVRETPRSTLAKLYNGHPLGTQPTGSLFYTHL